MRHFDNWFTTLCCVVFLAGCCFTVAKCVME